MVGQMKYLLLLGALYYETGQLVKAKDYYTRVCLFVSIIRSYVFLNKVVDLSQPLKDRDL